MPARNRIQRLGRRRACLINLGRVSSRPYLSILVSKAAELTGQGSKAPRLPVYGAGSTYREEYSSDVLERPSKSFNISTEVEEGRRLLRLPACFTVRLDEAQPLVCDADWVEPPN